MRKLAIFMLMAALAGGIADAQSPSTGTNVEGVVINRSTLNSSTTITAGGTFQVLLPSIIGTTTPPRQALTIQNNNTNTDNCWIFLGSATASEAKSIVLSPGTPYTRYWPFVPSDEIQVTCTGTSDTIYVDNQ